MPEIFDVEIRNVTKQFSPVKKAVDNFSLNVPHGSFTTLLGPSGCGKTTLLRMISGFLTQDSGEIFICGENQKNIPPEKRTVGIVFQDYALFTHLTARKNIEYGLKVRNVPKAERDTLVEEIAVKLGLSDELEKFPHEMSGGQQQRVALGRVLVLKPKILLMDEPLSNLDAKLRIRVREELKDLQSEIGITTIYVTHDQTEALSLSDQIAVIQKGKLEQCGTPKEIYETPKTHFAADFVGDAIFVHDQQGKEFVIRPEWISLALADKSSASGSCSASGSHSASGNHSANGSHFASDSHFASGDLISNKCQPKITVSCKVKSVSYFGASVIYRLLPERKETGSYILPNELIATAYISENAAIIKKDTEVNAVINKIQAMGN